MQKLMELTGIVLAFLPLIAAIAVLIAGFQRLRGRHARGVDRVAAVSSSAVARGIFPPSLRGGGPEVPIPPSHPIRRRRRRSRPIPAVIIAAAIAGVAPLALPANAAACSSPPVPFELLRSATTVVVGRVQKVARDGTVHVNVSRVLAGSVPTALALPPTLVSTTCGDPVTAAAGEQLLVALEVTFFGRRINPTLTFAGGDADAPLIGGPIEVPAGVATLEGVIAAFQALPPVTDTEPSQVPARRDPAVVLFISAAVGLALALLHGRVRPNLGRRPRP